MCVLLRCNRVNVLNPNNCAFVQVGIESFGIGLILLLLLLLCNVPLRVAYSNHHTDNNSINMKERPHSIIFSSSTTTATMASATVTTPSTTNIEATTFPHMGERFAHRGDGCNRNGGNGVGRTTNIPSNASYPHVTATTTNNNNNIGTNGTYNGHLKHKHVLAEIHSYSGDNWRAYAFISFVAIVCYLNGMNGEFVHDDIPAITLNRDVLGTNKISRVFKNDFWGTPMADANSHKSYRPLTVLSFR